MQAEERQAARTQARLLSVPFEAAGVPRVPPTLFKRGANVRLLVRVEARSDWSSLVTFGTVSMSYLATHWWARSGEG